MSENKIDCTKDEALKELANIEMDDNFWFGLIGLVVVSALGNNEEKEITDLENKK